MADELKLYPVGDIALGNGSLLQVTNVRHAIRNSATTKHTIRRSPAGIFRGPEDSDLSFDTIIDEDGYERDWIGMVKRGLIRQFRLKVPGLTISFVGMASEVTLEFSREDTIKSSVSLTGKSDTS